MLGCMQTPSAFDRAGWAARGGDDALHDELLGRLSCLHETEGRPAANARLLRGWVRVVTWNVQRGRRPTELAALLANDDAGLILLSELDSGMARSDNVDIPDVLAGALGAGYAYGVEFVELGLGDPLEQRDVAGRENARGLHGNAIVSPADIVDPEVVRLPGDGWFADPSQPRVGGRMALLASVMIDDTAVHVASTHLENRTDAGHRAEQMEVLLRALEERAGAGPAIVGGDFNTLGAGYEELFDRTRQRALRAADVRGRGGPRLHLAGRQRGRTDHRARCQRPARPRPAQARLAARARPGGTPADRRPRRPLVRPPGGGLLGAGTGAGVAMSVRVRPSRPEDAAAILAVVDNAFSDETRDAGEELDIVRTTWERRHGTDRIELVSEDDNGIVVGHVLAATGDLAGCAIPAVAPLGVVKDRHGAGIGTALMHAMIDQATRRGWPMLLLLGAPGYYMRFGFEPASGLGVFYGPAGPDNPHFMVRRLPGYDDATKELRSEYRYCWEL
jgi:predicted N-acetyltransferase YhbS/endonuclease/exonuclease/phosphatase family metal-dependent hydrolase